jgi:hypothetical protein
LLLQEGTTHQNDGTTYPKDGTIHLQHKRKGFLINLRQKTSAKSFILAEDESRSWLLSKKLR